MKEQSKHKNEAIFWLSIPKNPYNNILFGHKDGFEIFLIFGVQFWVIFSYLPVLIY